MKRNWSDSLPGREESREQCQTCMCCLSLLPLGETRDICIKTNIFYECCLYLIEKISNVDEITGSKCTSV